MNNYSFAVNTIEFAIAIAFFVWFFYGPWSRFIVDLTRQNLFELRDEIFLMCADKKLSFDSEVYLHLRERLNKMIRYCHQFTLINLIASKPVASHSNQKEDVLMLIRRIDDRELSRRLERMYFYAVAMVLVVIFLRSILLLILFVLLLPLILIAQLLKGASGINPIASKIRHAVERDIDLESRVTFS